MVEAVVEYDYTAQESDELTIRKGDVIRDVIKKPGGWWEGTLRDKRGMFPDNFVTVIHKENKVALRAKNNRLRQCRAVFSYHPAHDDELNLAVGDIIDVLCEVEEGWWKGRLAGLEGVFPSNFVVEIEPGKSQSKCNSREDLTSLAGETDPNIPNLPPKPTKIICQVKYPYEACNDDELTLREGDLITLISKDGQDRGWWRGELRGRVGVFPDNFVVVLPIPDINGSHSHKQEKKTDKLSTSKLSSSLSPQSNPMEDNTPKTNVASQRKSLELKQDDHKMPPMPGKKPNVPKKSPSSTTNANASSGPLSGLKQRLVDIVDGGASSRLANNQYKHEENDCDFDQVERSAMLSDMRANRAKGPGRRPPSTVYRELESGLVNGNSDYMQLAAMSETSNDEDDNEKKPKVREWEKHKAPWVEELKLNQARRTPPLTPASTDHSRLKLTPPNDKSISPSDNDTSDPKKEKEPSPIDMSKSMSALNTKLRTPPNDVNTDVKSASNVAIRTKAVGQPVTATPVRPQSIHGVMVTSLTESHKPATQSPSPVSKPPVAEKNLDSKMSASSPRSSIDKKSELVSMKQYLELQDRLLQLEAKMLQQLSEMQGTIDELRSKLQIETDMRRLLQAELEKVAQCVTQV